MGGEGARGVGNTLGRFCWAKINLLKIFLFHQLYNIIFNFNSLMYSLLNK